MNALRDHVDQVALIDHHCHGITLDPLSRGDLELLITESGVLHHRSHFDTPTGLAVRAECAPLLDLPRHCSAEEYTARRTELGPLEVAQRLLQATGIGAYLVDTGYHGTEICTPAELGALADAPALDVARLEVLAEAIAPEVDAHDLPRALREAVESATRSSVGFKSIIAYRNGLDFDPTRPSAREVVEAADAWYKHADRTGSWRLDDPVIMRYLLYCAVDTARPIQFHVGFGDSDAVQHRCNPSHLTEFIATIEPSGSRILLLHCYPFIREAGILCHVFPHVWMDVGLTLNYLGPSAETAMRESLEIAPFGKQLFSSDAFGLPELFLTGAVLWRRTLANVLDGWLERDLVSVSDAQRYVDWMAHGNAAHVYGLAEVAR